MAFEDDGEDALGLDQEGQGGSQTVGFEVEKLNAQARPWLEQHRPQYVEQFFGS